MEAIVIERTPASSPAISPSVRVISARWLTPGLRPG
jgi:hypothetical protein